MDRVRHVFINAQGVVVNAIEGILSIDEKERFLRDYRILFGATSVVEVDSAAMIWIGGSYDSTSGEFSPPPSPEPEPEPIVVDAPIEEVEEPTNDAA